MREIIFYRTESGKCPVEEFLDSLHSKEAQKVTWVLRLIEELPRIPSQYFKKLINTDDIWEVRVVLGKNIFRILGFWDGSRLIVLTHAFQKKTQKTPQQAIKIAEARKREYLQGRYKNERSSKIY
jgi:phage-related protein